MIDRKTVKRIAELAKIEVGQEEGLSGQLSKIIYYIDKLKEAGGDEITASAALEKKDSKKSLRKDQPREDSSRQDILKNAPGLEDNLFKVPRVIK